VSPRASARPRLLPVVIVAAAGLLGLKLMGLVLNGGYLLAPEPKAAAPGFGRSVAAVRANPDYTGMAPTMPSGAVASQAARVSGSAMLRPDAGADQIITGSAGPKKDEAADKKAGDKARKDDGKAGKDAKAEPPAQPLPPPQPSTSERQVLENLGARRQQLEERAKELELREQLLKSAEKMVQDKIGDLKSAEGKAEGAAPRDTSEAAAMRPVVVMYEAMKPRDAARVFEKMAPAQLAPLARQMNPRKLSEVMALMAPDAAEKLTQVLMRPQAPPQPRPGQPPGVAPLPVEELPRLPPPAPKR